MGRAEVWCVGWVVLGVFIILAEVPQRYVVYYCKDFVAEGSGTWA